VAGASRSNDRGEALRLRAIVADAARAGSVDVQHTYTQAHVSHPSQVHPIHKPRATGSQGLEFYTLRVCLVRPGHRGTERVGKAEPTLLDFVAWTRDPPTPVWRWRACDVARAQEQF